MRNCWRNFVKQYYEGTPFVAREIFLPEDIAERESIGAVAH